MPEEQGDLTVTVIVDYQGRSVRLTEERRARILEHPEMVGQVARLFDVLSKPELVVATSADESIRVYHRFYDTTPVTSKYLQVAVKLLANDAFVVTAFYSSRRKRGSVVWQV